MLRWVFACVFVGATLAEARTVSVTGAKQSTSGTTDDHEDDESPTADLTQEDRDDDFETPAERAQSAVEEAAEDADGSGDQVDDTEALDAAEAGGASEQLAAEPDPPPQGGHFPTPHGLVDDVRFWEKVFGRYSPDECMFHDKDHLAVIYAVKRLPGDTVAKQARAMRRYLGVLRASLRHLAEGGGPRNAVERRMVDITEARLRYPAYWRYAMDNVRCQRGVDLTPSLARSKRHVKMVKRILAQQGLPTDLAYLPHLESGYDVRARSRAGARGLWQLMPITARLAGLKVTRSSDFRTDPLKATVAAAGMLKDFYSRTRSWPLAVTAYNYGINGTVRAIKRWGANYMTVRSRHHTKLFGFAARNYYPSFLAVRNVASAQDADVRR